MGHRFDGTHVHATTGRLYRYIAEYELQAIGVDWVASVIRDEGVRRLDGRELTVGGEAAAYFAVTNAVHRLIDEL